ncbi:MAG: CoA transferase [Bryobacteraceae bacterium]|jgi:crotonobetainyl-CoA:carnitine CoA-transferase CaiB-like acyl-CoA transferase
MKNTPLEDVTVLDLTTALAGPFATLLLAGLGAKVIKIENPADGGDTCRSNAPYLGAEGATLARQHEDDVSVSALNRLRNKQGVTLNLKHSEARDIYADLVKTADVVVENFSRGTLDRLGVGYTFAQEVNPRIVYCSITGFGSKGEPGTGKAMDAIIQALSGVMLTSGGPGDPPVRIGVPFADLTAPLFGVIGALAAIHQAQRTGIGQHVDVSMLGVMTMMVSGEPFDLLERCGVPQRTGLTVPRLAPFGIYRTKDGYVSICAPTEAFAHSLFRAIGRPELTTDPRFAARDDRVVNVSELDAIVEAFTCSRTNAEVIAALDDRGVPAAEVRDPMDAVRDPRVVSRGETVLLEHPKYGVVEDVYGMGMPIKFSAAQAGFDAPPPALGEHNHAVYCGLLGYSEERLEELKTQRVI